MSLATHEVSLEFYEVDVPEKEAYAAIVEAAKNHLTTRAGAPAKIDESFTPVLKKSSYGGFVVLFKKGKS